MLTFQHGSPVKLGEQVVSQFNMQYLGNYLRPAVQEIFPAIFHGHGA